MQKKGRQGLKRAAEKSRTSFICFSLFPLLKFCLFAGGACICVDLDITGKA
jgi:hypothetical protein